MAVGKINSRSKGNRNERIAAKLFATWTGKDFARTPSSGGLSWKSSNSKGDIVCTTEGHYFPFCIEIKAHREINFQHLLYLPKPKISEFWEQCKGDAERANKTPMLLMRYDGLPKGFFFVVIQKKVYIEFNMFSRESNCRNTLTWWHMDKEALIIVPSTDFFKLPYKPIKLTLKKLRKNGK